ncbi:uncharacterized protein LOC142167167 [Nicotiana tabacum]|uniref:Uncharacterized protein LOC142167167 n=1 Tax=Nicotiana tabacum TaxID=4097 RepID=A0AC58SEL5_TOBAC
MSLVSKELVTGIVYGKDASTIWADLRERFDKVNMSRIFQFHKGIATITQGNDIVSIYFSKLKDLWDEFDSMVHPPCNFPTSRDFMEHMRRQKLLQFLMGLNDSYEQARSQILITNPTPTVNKAYSMIIERERESKSID